ncbi:MAG: TIGR00296 family protein [Anaerolineales bacterium]|nr:TIGR00296 family protein [Anaerolineales bacterium]
MAETHKFTLEQGVELVGLAKRAAEAQVRGVELVEDENLATAYAEPRGCFVTLFRGGQLRGCIGYPQPVLPLYAAVVSAARDVTQRDPRFLPVKPEELPEINVEVSVLTPPTLIEVAEPQECIENIVIGEDGLYIRAELGSGLLLPQVASEREWDVLTFLEHTCYKAGLPLDAWKDLDGVRIYKFQSQIFEEVEPGGEIVEL